MTSACKYDIIIKNRQEDDSPDRSPAYFFCAYIGNKIADIMKVSFIFRRGGDKTVSFCCEIIRFRGTCTQFLIAPAGPVLIYRKDINSMNENYLRIKKMVYSAACLALALVLPFLTGQIPEIGNALNPMHIPVFLCGFLCGWPYGLIVGAAAPLLRSAIFHMPPLFPTAISMAFELAVYGFVSGILYKKLPKKLPYIYITLIMSMIGGRIVWGTVRFILAGFTNTQFPFSAFIAGAITNAVPGIILHIILIPVLVTAFKKAKLILND